MSFKSGTFYWAICDICGADSCNATEAIYESEADAIQGAECADWYYENGTMYCDGCAAEKEAGL